jgi:hypothetical protein
MGKITILSLLLMLLLGCSSPSNYTITGNVDRDISATSTGALDKVFEQIGIEAEYALIVASDGTSVLLSERSFPLIEIVKKRGKFGTIAEQLPPVCSLNNIGEIIVYHRSYPMENYLTPFSSRMKEFEFLGESSKGDHFVRKYKRR